MGLFQKSVIGAVAVAMLVCASLAFAIGRSLSAQLAELTRLMQRLAKGDLNAQVPSARSNDAISDMTGALSSFKDALLAKMALERESLRAAEAQAQMVRSLASGLERLSAGDLACKIGNSVSTEDTQIRADFNEAIERLEGIITTVVSNGRSIRSGAVQITEAADDLAQRTQQQADSLKQTATALDAITAIVNQSAQKADHVKSIVASAKQDAEQSGEIVRQAVAAMSAIEFSAKEIGKIIGVIDDIASETNLLALNAGMEAARAGAAGGSFAVVASQVRALASRSADAAREIKSLISESSAQVDRGVAMVGQTGSALQRIVVQVTEINSLVVDIPSSARLQATELIGINSAISEMDVVTQQNATKVQKQTTASYDLMSGAQRLVELTDRFVVGSASTSASAAPNSAAASV